MELNKKFLREVEELIDIAHQASSKDSTTHNRQKARTSGELGRQKSVKTSQHKKSAKPKSRLNNIQKAFILSEILPRKY